MWHRTGMPGLVQAIMRMAMISRNAACPRTCEVDRSRRASSVRHGSCRSMAAKRSGVSCSTGVDRIPAWHGGSSKSCWPRSSTGADGLVQSGGRMTWESIDEPFRPGAAGHQTPRSRPPVAPSGRSSRRHRWEARWQENRRVSSVSRSTSRARGRTRRSRSPRSSPNPSRACLPTSSSLRSRPSSPIPCQVSGVSAAWRIPGGIALCWAGCR